MSISTPNNFELLSVVSDNIEFDFLAKDQVGNLYRIREDLGDEDYVVESYKSVTSLDDSFSYYNEIPLMRHINYRAGRTMAGV